MSRAKPLSRSLTFFLALTTGLAVSSIYLIQPILNTLSLALNAPIARIGLVMTLTQVGYGLGIFFLVPLGDVLERRRFIFSKLILLAFALAATGLARGLPALFAGSLAIGFFGTAAQDVVPLAADLAEEKRRGEIVGKVMSGLFLGILLSRTVSGFISDLWGWRAVFELAAALTFAVALAFFAFLETDPPRESISYRRLIRSTLKNFAIYPTLRHAILTQGLIGIAFSAFWTNLSFFLARPPFELTNTQIGLFGLAGAAGAMIAPIAGKLSDRRGPRLGVTVGAILVVLSFAAMRSFSLSLFVLIAATVVFDLGAQMVLISNQTAIYALDPKSRSRFNALFVSGLFLSFSLGSAISVQIQSHAGWTGVLTLGLMTSTLALVNALIRR